MRPLEDLIVSPEPWPCGGQRCGTLRCLAVTAAAIGPADDAAAAAADAAAAAAAAAAAVAAAAGRVKGSGCGAHRTLGELETALELDFLKACRRERLRRRRDHVVLVLLLQDLPPLLERR